MSFPIKIEAIIEELEIQFDEYQTFLNTNTGEFISVSSDELIAAEDEEPFDHLSGWELEVRMAAIDIVNNFEDYLEIPTKYDINEYEMIEEFCLVVRDQNIRNKLIVKLNPASTYGRKERKEMVSVLAKVTSFLSVKMPCLGNMKWHQAGNSASSVSANREILK